MHFIVKTIRARMHFTNFSFQNIMGWALSLNGPVLILIDFEMSKIDLKLKKFNTHLKKKKKINRKPDETRYINNITNDSVRVCRKKKI